MLPRRPSIFKCTRLDIKTRGFSTTIAENGSRVSQFGSAKSWPRLSALSSLESSRLPNNLTITTKGVPTKISGFSLCLPAGSRYEPADKGGVAHFLKNSFFMVCLQLVSRSLLTSLLLEQQGRERFGAVEASRTPICSN